MNRNSSSHFSATDNQVNIGRSVFNRDSWFKGTFNCGDLVPFYVDEVLPGDTFDMKTSLIARMATPLFPVMDNAYLDTYYFFVPNRLVWEHWKEFNGENNVNSWVNPVEYQVPKLSLADAKMYSVADYFGLPLEETAPSGYELDGSRVSALPFRAYQLIWNEWFRDQNLQDPVLISRSDVVSNAEKVLLLKLRKANKFHDYFTSALPAPQKGPAVIIPGLFETPVVTGLPNNVYGASAYPMTFSDTSGMEPAPGTYNLLSDTSSGDYGKLSQGETLSSEIAGAQLVPNNLMLSTPTNATIDALRTAFQVQKLLWRDGNGGTRYTEIIRSHFGVVSPDARLQRPEYLGGKRVPLTMNQVIQNSSNADEPTPLGNTGAYSKTVDSFDGFSKSFTEHGYLIGVCCVRCDHTYQQGINKMWTRSSRFDFYYPELANIGEQPVLQKELFAYSIAGDDSENVFGYQEAWAEYRYRPSYCTGAFRTNAPSGSLDSWHYADYYESLPYLSSNWIEEPSSLMDRTLAVQSAEDKHEQILLDMFFKLRTTRPMPVYSVPGLVDHF